jgi:CheY-like chemotaxis protein
VTAPTVLIVEDDADSRVMMAAMLTLHGYSTRLAADGAEALRQARASRPCLILLDLMMPVMDGASFRAEQLADPALSSIPVMIISGRHNALSLASELGAVGVMAKPVMMDALLHAVRSHCGPHPDGREQR